MEAKLAERRTLNIALTVVALALGAPVAYYGWWAAVMYVGIVLLPLYMLWLSVATLRADEAPSHRRSA